MSTPLIFKLPLIREMPESSLVPTIDIFFANSSSLEPSQWTSTELCTALIDTGANMCVLNLAKFDVSPLQLVQGSLEVTNSGYAPITVSAFQAAFADPVSGLIFREVFIGRTFDEGTNFDIILGMDFIRHASLVIDRGSKSGHLTFASGD